MKTAMTMSDYDDIARKITNDVAEIEAVGLYGNFKTGRNDASHTLRVTLVALH
jgi:hypothetical protein